MALERLYIGVDPGDSGAVAAIGEDGRLVWVVDMVDAKPELFFPEHLAAVEAQHAFPNIPAQTNFKMGVNLGYWRGVFEAIGVPFEEVAASKWQRAICGALPKDRPKKKRAIAEWAGRRWPTAELRGPRGAVLDGRSDALCLAEYARRQFVAYQAAELVPAGARSE